MKCTMCNKPLKENTEGNKRYCQGHDIVETLTHLRYMKNNVFTIKEDDENYCLHNFKDGICITCGEVA